jgi:hypothetical protein
MRIIDQLLYRNLVSEEDIQSIIEAALNHESAYIREEAALYLMTDEDEGKDR